MSLLIAHSAFLCHPLWHLACQTLSYFGEVEDRLDPGLHFALCGDWSGAGSAVDALRKSFGALQERRLQGPTPRPNTYTEIVEGHCPRDGGWWDAPRNRDIGYVCESGGSCAGIPAGPPRLQYEDVCYVYVEEEVTHSVAQSDCQGRFRGNLAKVDTRVKNREINELVRGSAVWIGLSEPRNCPGTSWDPECETWQWHDGSQLTYSNWEDGEPNNEGGSDEDAAFMNYCELISVEQEEYIFNFEEVLLIGFLVFLCCLAVLSVIFEGCFTCCYNSNVSKLRKKTAKRLEPTALQNGPYNMRDHSNNDFPFRTCGCLSQWEACFHAVFCPVARIGDTQLAALGPHHADVWALWIIWSAGFLLGCGLDAAMQFRSRGQGQDFQLRNQVTNLCIALYAHKKRQEIRRRFGGDPGPFFVKDFFCWWCCTICTATQEARTVDTAAGLRSKCCCKLARLPSARKSEEVQMAAPPETVGEPVGAPVAVSPGDTAVTPQEEAVPAQDTARPSAPPQEEPGATERETARAAAVPGAAPQRETRAPAFPAKYSL